MAEARAVGGSKAGRSPVRRRWFARPLKQPRSQRRPAEGERVEAETVGSLLQPLPAGGPGAGDQRCPGLPPLPRPARPRSPRPASELQKTRCPPAMPRSPRFTFRGRVATPRCATGRALQVSTKRHSLGSCRHPKAPLPLASQVTSTFPISCFDPSLQTMTTKTVNS